VTLDSGLSLDSHVSETVKNCHFHLRALQHIRPSLTREVANTIACSVVAARIDYCNSLLAGVSEKNLDKLQRTQNRAARIVCNVGRRQSSSRDLLAVLHWLPVRQRVEYKLATLCFKAYKLNQPPYLSAAVQLYIPQRTLRSTTKELLIIPPHKTVLGSRRFSVAAPTIWNELPVTLRSVDNFKTFKTGL
jgi:hypothetical protein